MDKKSATHLKTYAQIGMIIGQVNLVESRLNQVIADYYIEEKINLEKNNALSNDFLFSGMIRLDDKLKLLEIISSTKNLELPERIKKDLKQWKEIRNTVAHGIPGHTANFDVEILFNGKFHNIDKMRKGFGIRQDRITTFLDKLKDS